MAVDQQRQACVAGDADRCGDGKAQQPNRLVQPEIEGRTNNHHNGAKNHGGQGVFSGVEAACRDGLCRPCRKPDGEDRQNLGCHLSVFGRELPSAKDHKDRGTGDRDQAGGGDDGRKRDALNAGGQHLAHLFQSIFMKETRQIGQGSLASSLADDREGHQHQLATIIQPRDGAVRMHRSKVLQEPLINGDQADA